MYVDSQQKIEEKYGFFEKTLEKIRKKRYYSIVYAMRAGIGSFLYRKR